MLTMPEHQSLPVFQTEDGSLIDEWVGQDLTSGFKLEEVSDQPEYDTICEFHKRHTQVARYLLVLSEALTAGSTTQHVATQYSHPIATEAGSTEHFDGLVGSYFQSHSTATPTEGSGRTSELTLRRYKITARFHTHLQDLLLAGPGEYKGAIHYVDFLKLLNSYDGNSGVDQLRAERSWQTTAAPFHTLVFPNGYNALPNTEAQDLFTHQFRTNNDDGYAGYRNIELSHIFPEGYNDTLTI